MNRARCRKLRENPDVNPSTNHKINPCAKYGIYDKLVRDCKNKHYLTPDKCRKLRSNPHVNPLTNQPIDPNCPYGVYRKMHKQCFGDDPFEVASVSSGDTVEVIYENGNDNNDDVPYHLTSSECEQLRRNPKVNPRTLRKIKPNAKNGIYKKLARYCKKYNVEVGSTANNIIPGLAHFPSGKYRNVSRRSESSQTPSNTISYVSEGVGGDDDDINDDTETSYSYPTPAPRPDLPFRPILRNPSGNSGNNNGSGNNNNDEAVRRILDKMDDLQRSQNRITEELRRPSVRIEAEPSQQQQQVSVTDSAMNTDPDDEEDDPRYIFQRMNLNPHPNDVLGGPDSDEDEDNEKQKKTFLWAPISMLSASKTTEQENIKDVYPKLISVKSNTLYKQRKKLFGNKSTTGSGHSRGGYFDNSGRWIYDPTSTTDTTNETTVGFTTDGESSAIRYPSTNDYRSTVTGTPDASVNVTDDESAATASSSPQRFRGTLAHETRNNTRDVLKYLQDNPQNLQDHRYETVNYGPDGGAPFHRAPPTLPPRTNGGGYLVPKQTVIPGGNVPPLFDPFRNPQPNTPRYLDDNQRHVQFASENQYRFISPPGQEGRFSQYQYMTPQTQADYSREATRVYRKEQQDGVYDDVVPTFGMDGTPHYDTRFYRNLERKWNGVEIDEEGDKYFVPPVRITPAQPHYGTMTNLNTDTGGQYGTGYRDQKKKRSLKDDDLFYDSEPSSSGLSADNVYIPEKIDRVPMSKRYFESRPQRTREESEMSYTNTEESVPPSLFSNEPSVTTTTTTSTTPSSTMYTSPRTNVQERAAEAAINRERQNTQSSRFTDEDDDEYEGKLPQTYASSPKTSYTVTYESPPQQQLTQPKPIIVEDQQPVYKSTPPRQLYAYTDDLSDTSSISEPSITEMSSRPTTNKEQHAEIMKTPNIQKGDPGFSQQQQVYASKFGARKPSIPNKYVDTSKVKSELPLSGLDLLFGSNRLNPG